MSQEVRLIIKNAIITIIHDLLLDIDVMKRHVMSMTADPADLASIEIRDIYIPHQLDDDQNICIIAGNYNPLEIREVVFTQNEDRLDVTIAHGNDQKRTQEFEQYFAATICPLIEELFSMDTDDFFLERGGFRSGMRVHIWSNYEE